MLTLEWNFKVRKKIIFERFVVRELIHVTRKSFWWKVLEGRGVQYKQKIKLCYQKCTRVDIFEGVYHTTHKLLRCCSTSVHIAQCIHDKYIACVRGACMCVGAGGMGTYKVTHFKVSLCLYLLTI